MAQPQRPYDQSPMPWGGGDGLSSLEYHEGGQMRTHDGGYHRRSSSLLHTTAAATTSVTLPQVSPLHPAAAPPLAHYASVSATTGLGVESFYGTGPAPPSQLQGHPSGSRTHGMASRPQYSQPPGEEFTTWDYAGRRSPVSSNPPSYGGPFLDNAGSSVPLPAAQVNSRARPQRHPSNRDEFDGPHQFLRPRGYIVIRDRELPRLPTHLSVQEQDSVLSKVNERLSQCAYDFVAQYQFPVPLTPDRGLIERPEDWEWSEWVHLLKRLATKRRIPARVLYDEQIRQFVTTLENSLEVRYGARHQPRPPKDDRSILQLISAGIQVAKIVKDADAMEYLDRLYVATERRIQELSAAHAAGFGTF
ncbi:hypothetical protein VTK73DRAFT_9822 [Phialemonium thermophilum]|uniref:Uncharacterized protein n=1 Tax=Phialemonium thermophilum TaxID=223376 RepID=A0ABR3XII4_9PEZI